MLYWEDQKKGLANTEGRIKEAVLELGKTVDTGNVRASYSAGRKKYDYAAGAVVAAGLGSFAQFERLVVDHRAVCKHFGVKDIPFTQSEPSVTVKLLE
jgi:hypothetical protein